MCQFVFMNMANYETHQGVTLKRVRVTSNLFFADHRLKVEAGAVGLLASHHEGRGLVTFEYHDNQGLYIERDGGGRKAQFVELIDLEDA